MPVGTSFENSAMKTSFSLSSLQAESTPDKCVKPRLCSSLKKNRIKATAVRRSWGSTASEHREEFWSALQANYNYIMDNQLIDKCQESNNDLSVELSGAWSLKEIYLQFSELYLWLNSVQETIYGKEENITDKALRARCVNMILEKSSALALFNEQASQLVQFHPGVQEEVGWRVTHLNAKWDSILSILGPSDCGHCEQDYCLDIDHEVKCLRKWFKVMESSLQPLNFRAKYTKTEIEKKGLELKVLHRDIENHGKIVGSVVKLCKKSDTSCNTVNVRRIINGLERRWHLLFLRSLEWQCYLESLSKKENSRNTSSSSDDSGSDCYEEPVNKYPRLTEREYPFINGDNNISVEDDSVFDKEIFDKSIMSEELSNNNNNNNNNKSVEINGQDILDGNCNLLNEDSSQFNKSNRKARNFGTYYFKHEDTDSDMDRIDKISEISKNEVQSTLEEETSEEEWTFVKNTEEKPLSTNEHNIIETVPVKPKIIPDDTIRRLVIEAEELVSPDKCRKEQRINSLSKMSRVKKWLSMDKPDDSCDASGEDEKESQFSEDFDESTTTFRASQGYNSQNTSYTELDNSEITPKVNMRQKKYTGHRPWSVSCISQLDHSTPRKIIQNDITNFSISESALHKIMLTSKNLERFNAVSAHSIGVNSNISTSSTVEESFPILYEKSPLMRRRKLRFKKKFAPNNKCDVQMPYIRKSKSMLTKSGSFSGCSSKILYNERHTSSDPPATNLSVPGKYETSTSGADSEDDINKKLPNFKLGLKTNYLKTDLRDTSPGKSSLNTTEEQSSSLSEQAWDSYQEKYLSEAYSEAHDSDAARKLLEFGEDYRNFLDSQSDWSTNPDFSPTFKRKILLNYGGDGGAIDSDSDAESLKLLINSSRDQLNYTRDIYSQQVSLGFMKYLKANEVDEMISTCDRHVDLLSHIERSSDEFAMSKSDKGIAADLLMQWRRFRESVLIMQEYRNLQKEIVQARTSLTTIDIPEGNCVIDLGSVDDLPKEIDYYEKTLEEIYEYKKRLLTLNVTVHRFVVENKEYDGSSLKTDISELYRIWENLFTSTKERLAQLKPLMQTWKTLETRLDQLQGDLRGDDKTLHFLDSVLEEGGGFTDHAAVCVRDIAKLLSETTLIEGYSIPELFSEGYLTDSGISDEGSEFDLGERERRLAAIRRLVRQLEIILAPDCQARIKMTARLNAAEDELKTLQNRCKSLIVRRAVSSGASVRFSELHNQIKSTLNSNNRSDGGDDDPDNESRTTSWFKRILKASVPFQVVMVAILCVVYLLQPQCCDNMNNFAMSFSPQLRYTKGPPPI